MAAKIKGIEGEGNCEMCGTYCPKRRIALEIESGEVVLYGSECAKKIMGCSQKDVTARAIAAQEKTNKLLDRIGEDGNEANKKAKRLIAVGNMFVHPVVLKKLFPHYMTCGERAVRANDSEVSFYEKLGFKMVVIE
jgi:hypothetical protein